MGPDPEGSPRLFVAGYDFPVSRGIYDSVNAADEVLVVYCPRTHQVVALEKQG